MKRFTAFTDRLQNGLENMRALMGRLGNPQEKLTMVHVAGTNGKEAPAAR